MPWREARALRHAAVAFVALIAFCTGASPAGPVAAARTVIQSPPHLGTFAALLSAGGGTTNFKTITLVGVLARQNDGTEMAELVKAFGAADIKEFVVAFDFTIADALRLLKARHVALPATSAQDPTDGKTLSAALYAAGIERRDLPYDADLMFDRLVSVAVRVQIMKDINKIYGTKFNSVYHAVLAHLMHDLKIASA